MDGLGVGEDADGVLLAGELLGAGTVVPMHYDGFEIDPWYRPVSDAAARFGAAATGRPYEARVLELGESFEVASVPSAG